MGTFKKLSKKAMRVSGRSLLGRGNNKLFRKNNEHVVGAKFARRVTGDKVKEVIEDMV